MKTMPYTTTHNPITRQHQHDAGIDLHAVEETWLLPGQRALIHTGIHVALPPGTVGFITPRSGLALNHGVTVLNTPGTIDENYRGELGVILINHDPTTAYKVDAGERIAQLVILPVLNTETQQVDELPDHQDERGTGGFGSTGAA